MVTMVIVFEELNRVVSLSPTKERMKAKPSWGEGTDSGDWRCEQTMGKSPDCWSDH